jgi:predicted metal-dependent enzyme (double-stranded beta helix superfamily)
VVYSDTVSTGDFPSPLRRFLAQLEELRSAEVLDMDQVGRLLVELAADEEYLGPLIAEMPSESAGGKWLVKPERGPRLVLFHRPEGVMAYTHSHHCWVGIAPVRGVETHQRYLFERNEYDPQRGTWRNLAPGDPGRSHR